MVRFAEPRIIGGRLEAGAADATIPAVDEGSSETIASRSRSPLKFFLLVFALSIPFALIGEVNGLQLFPGIPVAALAFACPAIAAVILSYRENGTRL